MRTTRLGIGLAGLALASMMSVPAALLEPASEPAHGSRKNKPSGSRPVAGGGAKERARRLARMEQDKLLNPPMENSGETGNARAAPAMTGSLPIADAAPTISTGDRRLSNHPKSHFDDCPQHEWKAVDSQSDNEWRHGVVCTKCGCPGDADNETGAVVWPAT